MNKGLEKPRFTEVCYYPTKADLSRRWLTVRSTVYKEAGSELPFFGPQSTSLSERGVLYVIICKHLTSNSWASGRPNTSEKNTDVVLREKGNIN